MCMCVGANSYCLSYKIHGSDPDPDPIPNPLTLTLDGHVLAQCLERIRESKGGLPGGEFEEAVTAARAAREGIMVSLRAFDLAPTRSVAS